MIPLQNLFSDLVPCVLVCVVAQLDVVYPLL